MKYHTKRLSSNRILFDWYARRLEYSAQPYGVYITILCLVAICVIAKFFEFETWFRPKLFVYTAKSRLTRYHRPCIFLFCNVSRWFVWFELIHALVKGYVINSGAAVMRSWQFSSEPVLNDSVEWLLLPLEMLIKAMTVTGVFPLWCVNVLCRKLHIHLGNCLPVFELSGGGRVEVAPLVISTPS